VSILPSPEAVSRRPVVSGSHRAVGIFGAQGPAIRRGLAAGELSILDVAPTVLYSLGLPVPEVLQGRVPEEIYQQDFLARHPVRRVSGAAGATNGLNSQAAASTEMEDEETVLERLRELGYIE